jgi:hypothetical protein
MIYGWLHYQRVYRQIRHLLTIITILGFLNISTWSRTSLCLLMKIKLLKNLNHNYLKDAKVVLVTDEADFASHTKISIERLFHVSETFNVVVEHIVMTGTGYGKASKIFKNISLDDINSIYFTYTEMTEIGGDVVKRRFINVQMDITEDFGENVLNIRQTKS